MHRQVVSRIHLKLKIKMSNENAAAVAAGNEIALRNSTDLDNTSDFDLNGLPLTKEFLDFVKEAQRLEAEVESLNAKTTKASDLLGKTVSITDAIVTTIPDAEAGEKSVVLFKVIDEDSGEVHTVMHSANPIRQRYCELFASRKVLAQAMGKPLPVLSGYRFAEDDRYSRAGNKAIVLQKI